MGKVSVKPSASGNYNHKYNPTSILSLDFGNFGVTRVIEVNPKDNFKKISGTGILRCQPQVFPAYGKSYLKQAGFFVSLNQLYEAGDAFRQNQHIFKGQTVTCPSVSSLSINQLFLPNSWGGPSTYNLSTAIGGYTDPTTAAAIADANASDFTFIYLDENNNISYEFFKLTVIGQRYYNLLKALGYDFIQYRYPHNNNIDQLRGYSAISLNIFPLLAFAKVYTDIFLNSELYNKSILVALLHSIRHGNDYQLSGTYLYRNSILTVEGLSFILESVLVPHSSSLYIDAWNLPESPDGTSPLSDTVSVNSTSVVSPYNVDTFDTVQNYVSNGKGTGFSSISHFSDLGLRFLNKFSDFIIRNGIAGSKSIDRVLINLGVNPDDLTYNFARKLFETSIRLNSHPVLSNADTVNGNNGQRVGAYSGFSAESIDFNYSYKSNDYGYIIQLAWLQLEPILTRGIDPQVLRFYPFDFYTPQFDGEAIRPIPSSEICIPKTPTDVNKNQCTKQDYGFINLYDDYRYMRDIVAGDFISGGAKDFLFSRDLSKINSVLKPQTAGVHYFDQVSNKDLSNPFYLDETLGDRFYLQLDFDIDANRPIKSRSDALLIDGGSGDTEINYNGDKVH